MLKQISTGVSDAVTGVVDVTKTAGKAVISLAGDDSAAAEAAKAAERQARLAAAQAEQKENPMTEVAAKAQESFRAAAGWVETNVAPHVDKLGTVAKEQGEPTLAQLSEEGIMTKESLEESLKVASERAIATTKEPHPFIMNTVIGEVPFMDRIPNAKIAPPVATDAFILWNVVCLLLGYADVTLFALGHSMKDAFVDLPTYLPMYVLKLGVDLAVCTAVAYGIHFTFTRSKSAQMKHVVLAFLAFVIVKCALVFYFYTNLLALVEALANAVLLLRAYMLFKAKGTEYATLKDDDTVVVDMPKSPSAAEALV